MQPGFTATTYLQVLALAGFSGLEIDDAGFWPLGVEMLRFAALPTPRPVPPQRNPSVVLSAMARVWPTLAVAMTDGLHLWPVDRSRITIALFCGGGFLVGAFHFAFSDIYTESVGLMGVLIAIGIVFPSTAAQIILGLAFGSAITALVGDFANAKSPQLILWSLVVTIVSTAVVYILLIILAIIAGQSSRKLARNAQLPKIMKNHFLTANITRLLLELLMTVGLVWTWVHAIPLLTRSVFIWHGRTPTAISSVRLATNGYILLIAASTACVARSVLGGAVPSLRVSPPSDAVIHADVRARIKRLENQPKWLRMMRTTLQTTFILSGICQSWVDALAMAAALAGCNGARLYELFREPSITASIDGVHVAIRMALWIFAVLLFSLALSVSGVTGFWPILSIIVFSLLTFNLVLSPDRASRGR